MVELVDTTDLILGNNMIDTKRYSVYVNKDGRYRCYDRVTQKVVSYPRILMAEKLGRPLEPYEEVHHIDGNTKNNSLDNLTVVNKGEHQRYHSIKYPELVFETCVYCGKKFAMTRVQQQRRKSEEKRGKYGPFCSRRCSGLYGTDEQRKRKNTAECA